MAVRYIARSAAFEGLQSSGRVAVFKCFNSTTEIWGPADGSLEEPDLAGAPRTAVGSAVQLQEGREVAISVRHLPHYLHGIE